MFVTENRILGVWLQIKFCILYSTYFNKQLAQPQQQ